MLVDLAQLDEEAQGHAIAELPARFRQELQHRGWLDVRPDTYRGYVTSRGFDLIKAVSAWLFQPSTRSHG